MITCVWPDKVHHCFAFLVVVVVAVSLSSEDFWRNVIHLIMLPQSRGHVHAFMSNQVAVSMETEAAECYVQHLALMANCYSVGSRAHIEHVGYVENDTSVCLFTVSPLGLSTHADILTMAILTLNRCLLLTDGN